MIVFFYRSIKMALGDTTSVQEDGDRFIVPSDILFQTGSYRLSAEGKNQVRLLSHVIKGLEEKIPTNIDWIIRIDGHTDKKPVVPGNRSYADNMQLSILRARAVMNDWYVTAYHRVVWSPVGLVIYTQLNWEPMPGLLFCKEWIRQ